MVASCMSYKRSMHTFDISVFHFDGYYLFVLCVENLVSFITLQDQASLTQNRVLC